VGARVLPRSSTSPEVGSSRGPKDDRACPATMFQGAFSASDRDACDGLHADARRAPLPAPSRQEFPLRCRGQATPSSKKLVYEVFLKSLTRARHRRHSGHGRWSEEFPLPRRGARTRRRLPLSRRPDLLGHGRVPMADAVGGTVSWRSHGGRTSSRSIVASPRRRKAVDAWRDVCAVRPRSSHRLPGPL
jgi:hypothetical protein